MPQVRIGDRRLWVGSQSRSLLHGEVHYWRLAPGNWAAILASVKSLGLDMVSTYVPWQFHETADNEFDFEGRTDPRRDLLGFLQLAQDHGFWVIARPGPYIYAEWRNSGVPDRVVQLHRAHPEFRGEARKWLEAVVEAIRPYLATRGGPIVLVQADNEPDPWADVYGAQLDKDAFEDPLGFSHAYATDIARWTASTLRGLGVDVPIYGNTYLGFGVQDWRALQEQLDLVGPDVYPTAEFRERNEHRNVLERLRFTRTFSPLPYIPEFESGIWHGWHERIGILRANHYRLLCLSALLAGVAGWGWYMLVNRDNWYMSPIDELGRLRPELAREFADIVRVFREMDPPSLTKVTDTTVGVDVRSFEARDGVLQALYDADVDYECFDVETGAIAKPLLFYASGEPNSRALQDYVEQGGTLVAFREVPAALGVKPFDGAVRDDHARALVLQLGQLAVQCVSSTFGFYRGDVPGEPITVTRGPVTSRQQGSDLHLQLPVGERYTIGYREQRGQGSIIVLGIAPSADVVVGIHRWLGVPISARAQTHYVSTALFEGENGRRYLIVVNTGDEERIAGIELSESATRVTDLFTGANWDTHGSLGVHLARKSGTVLRLD